MKMASPLDEKAAPSPLPTERHKSFGRGVRNMDVVWRDKINAYLRAHRYELVRSLRTLLSAPFSSVITILVIAIAIFLPIALVIIVNNIQLLGGNWDGRPKMTVYLQLDASENAILTAKQTVLALPGVESVNYIPADQALEEFKRHSGFVDILYELDENPLPAVLVVVPDKIGLSNDGSKVLLRQIETLAIVDSVQYDLGWVHRLNSFMALANRFIVVVTLLFSVGAILVVGNTVRLGIENRRREIIVGKLVGATHSFVRRPFLYLGVWYGLGGGLVAWLMAELGLFALSGPMVELAALYQANFQLQGFGLINSALMLVCSGLLGWLGAWLTVAHHLDEIEPL